MSVMDDNKDILEEPSVSYGQSFNLRDINYQPVSNMRESLKGQGCITLDEFVDKVSKYL
jgi:hypothetical protein